MNTQPLDAFVPRLRSLECELAEIRRDLVSAIVEARMDEEPVRPVAPPENHAEPMRAATPDAIHAAPALKSAMWPSFEQLVGGKALHLAGLLLVFLGAGFFLKVAFDHDWITPPTRVALGLTVGLGLIGYAQFLFKRGARYFSEGITALGASIQFLSLYAAGPVLKLLSPSEILIGMAAISTTLVVLGWYRRSERLGILGGIGGFLAPAIIGATNPNEWMLASYLAVFAAGLLVLADLLKSKRIAPLALLGTLAYGLCHFYGAPIAPVERVEILALLYTTFAVAGGIATRVRPSADPMRATIACVTLASFVLALVGLLSEHDRSLLAGVLLALTVAHLGAAILLRSRYQRWLAATAFTIAIPAQFHGAAFAAGWGIEAFFLVCTGLILNDPVLRFGGLGLLGTDLVRDLSYDASYIASVPFLNDRFISLGAFIAATFGINAALALKPFRADADARLSATLRIVGHAIALWMLTAETWDFASSGALHAIGTQGGNVAVSVLWTLFATVLIAAGLRKRDAMLRWEGLGLIVTAVAKVLLFDLSSLDLSYRVLSGIVVGAVLIGISYAYQHRTNVEMREARDA